MNSLFLVGIILNIIKLYIAQYETCDLFEICSSNATVHPSELSGIYYMIQHVSKTFFVGTTCAYINISAPEQGTMPFKQHFAITEVVDGKQRVSDGHFYSNETHINTVHTALQIPTDGRFFSFNPDYFAYMSCLECGFFRRQGTGVFMHVWSRLVYPECIDMDPLIASLNACGIPSSLLVHVDHTNCEKKC
ncbi:CLUMA_CG020425, isoform A [Clunio marinus]|uniref:CLUMA_CG020425, isoform A n=1 Tax=Clunio marinus TaxID=568069 RepID=A0A1J1J4X8_9DIPT|nr:CLUMA_CG020425, isoform A [Clunio marinus]